MRLTNQDVGRTRKAAAHTCLLRPAIAARGPPRIACERDSNRRETLCNGTKPGPGGALALACPGGSGGTWGINADQLEARTVERIREAKAARKTGSTRMY